MSNPTKKCCNPACGYSNAVLNREWISGDYLCETICVQFVTNLEYMPIIANRLDPAPQVNITQSYQCRVCGTLYGDERAAVACEMSHQFGSQVPYKKEIKVEYKDNTCNHQWEDYHGIVDHFTFCKLCDKRKE